MRKLLLAFLTLVTAVSYASGAGWLPLAKGSGYQGPGDVIGSAARFYSFGRSYNKAYAASAGTFAVLVDSSAPTTPICTLRSLTTGYVDLTAYCVGSVTPATKCAAATGGACNIYKWTDQSGNGDDLVMATAVSQPKLGFSVLDGLPCGDFTSSSSSIYLQSTGLLQPLPFNMMAIAERSADFTTSNQVISQLTGGINSLPYIQYRSVANSIALSASTQIQTSSGTNDGSFYALIGVIDLSANADSVLVVNGTIQAGPAATGLTGFVSPIVVGHIGSQTSGMKECELGVWPAAWTSTQYGNINSNMRSASNGWGAF